MDKIPKWIYLFLITFLFILQVNGIAINQTRISDAETIFKVGDLGRIKGLVKKTSGDLKREFVAFYGIPYANSSSGDYRYLPAEDITPPLTEEGKYFDATVAPCCPQYESVLCSHPGESQKEDCLLLYVATPLVQSNMAKLLPVIVFIHGGAFTSGGFILYNGARLLEHEVILVSIQYRLGVLGFFCLDIPEAPGNAAMYDMVQALTWVKKYIHHFGGDANKITVTGQSAGSVSVSQLLLSPMARKPEVAFHRAIALSGTALNEWGTTTAANAKEASLDVARRANCYDPTVPTPLPHVLTCMKTVESTTLLSALGGYQADERLAGRLGFAPVTPVIQTVAPATKEMFLSEKPLKILEEGRQANIPLMMGSTRHDGSYVLGVVYNEVLNPQGLQNNATFLRSLAMPMLMAALGIHDETGAVYDLLADAYMGKEVKSSGNFTMMTPGMIDLHSVFFFKAAELKTLSIHSRLQDQSFWYSFDYKGLKSLYPMQIGPNHPVPGGVSHADDLIYLFDIPLHGLTIDAEKAVSKRLTQYWANFAYSGNPNIGDPSFSLTRAEGEEWPNFSEDAPGFVVYNEEHTVIHDTPTNYWRGLSLELMPEIFPPPTTTTTEITTTAETITETTTTAETTTITTTNNPGNTTTTEAPSNSTDPSVTETTPSSGFILSHNYSLFIIIGIFAYLI